MKKCAVIGAGIGGLAAAVRLKAMGYDVDVYEANKTPGGKIRELRVDGFRFDAGPTVLTLPKLIDELFELHKKNPRDYFKLSYLEKPFRYFFEDGTVINSSTDEAEFAKEIEEKTSDNEESLLKYLNDSKTKYRITKPVFIESSIHRFKDFLSKDVLKGIWHFRKIDAFKSVNDLNSSIFKDPNLVTLFNNYATYVGSNPFLAPATLNVIHHAESNEGTAIPDGGVYSIVSAIYKLAMDVGVHFKFEHEVEEIVVEKERATGIIVKGNSLAYDVIVSNMDSFFTYKKLLGNKVKRPDKILDQPKSSSGIAFYWGVDKQFPDLTIHNMLFTKDQKNEFEAVYERKEISEDPSIYICVTSKHIKEDAPDGKENWFVLVTAPHNSGQDWEDLVAKTRETVINKINRVLRTDIAKHIECERILSPPDIERDYRSAFGALYGNSSNSKFAAFMRHPNFSRKIKGLYFVGGSVHPGAGIPMCLNSAKILSEVLKD